jgi:hypothetical protein
MNFGNTDSIAVDGDLTDFQRLWAKAEAALGEPLEVGDSRYDELVRLSRVLAENDLLVLPIDQMTAEERGNFARSMLPLQFPGYGDQPPAWADVDASEFGALSPDGSLAITWLSREISTDPEATNVFLTRDDEFDKVTGQHHVGTASVQVSVGRSDSIGLTSAGELRRVAAAMLEAADVVEAELAVTVMAKP